MSESQNREYIIGVDLGGTNIRIGYASMYAVSMALANHAEFVSFMPEQTRREKTSIVLADDAPKTALADFIYDYACEQGIAGKVVAIGLGVPSGFSEDKTIITWTGNIPSLQDVRIVEHLQERFGNELVVSMDGDTARHMQHDCIYFELDKALLAVGTYFGTGIGGGVIVGGKPYDGRHGEAGRVGHMPVIGQHGICGCGREGCVETCVSGTRLVEIARLIGCDVSEVFAHSDDEKVVAYVDDMSSVVATEMNLLDPDYCIVGGGIPNMPDFPKRLFEEKISRKILVDDLDTLLYAPANRETGIIGSIIGAYSGIIS